MFDTGRSKALDRTFRTLIIMRDADFMEEIDIGGRAMTCCRKETLEIYTDVGWIVCHKKEDAK